MFSKQDLMAGLTRLDEFSSSPIEKIEILPENQREEVIAAVRGFKSNYNSAACFWLKSLALTLYDPSEIGSYYQGFTECLPLTGDEFFGLISDNTQFVVEPMPKFIHPRHDFISAMRMSREWDEVSAIAEFKDEYVAFFWHTTA